MAHYRHWLFYLSAHMFFRFVCFILVVSPFGLMSDQSSKCNTGKLPAWVHIVPVETGAKPSQNNMHYLLIDSQRHWEEKTLYRHLAVKALTQTGIEKISQIRIDFDPAYYQVMVHAIRIFREGEWFDRLQSTRHHLVQRETELERNIYNGTLSLVYFLDDVRVGDIVEYSYSLVGGNSLFFSHYTDWVYLQIDFPVDRIVHRILGHPDLALSIKPVHTTIDPQIRDLSPTVREWFWEAVDTLPYSYESGQPIWYRPYAHVEMSQYKTWDEIAQKFYPLYALSLDFSQSVPSEMQAVVDQWKQSSACSLKRALQALRFVQDEIRYLGIEEGMGLFNPRILD